MIPSAIHPSIHLSIHPCIHPSVHLSACMRQHIQFACAPKGIHMQCKSIYCRHAAASCSTGQEPRGMRTDTEDASLEHTSSIHVHVYTHTHTFRFSIAVNVCSRSVVCTTLSIYPSILICVAFATWTSSTGDTLYYSTVPWQIVSCRNVSYRIHTIPYHITSYLIISYDLLSCHVMSIHSKSP